MTLSKTYIWCRMRDVPHNLLLGCQNKKVKTPTSYCSPCEAFTSDNDAMIEYGSEFPYGR